MEVQNAGYGHGEGCDEADRIEGKGVFRKGVYSYSFYAQAAWNGSISNVMVFKEVCMRYGYTLSYSRYTDRR